jgi:ribonuclease HI/exonuclease III
MIFVSWNCRGLGSKLKEEAVKDLVRMTSPDVLLIQESKMAEPETIRASKNFWKKGAGRAVSARGASGGLATFWNSSTLDLIEEHDTIHWLFTKLQHRESGLQVSLFNIYAPVLLSEKKDCWESLNNFLSTNQHENLILAGDLNVTLALSEKKGGTPVRDPAREWVEDLLLDWDLEDIKPSKGKFTWNNKRTGPGHIAARLDRFLVHSSFLTLGLFASSEILQAYTSDHKPISLSLTLGEKLGPIPFRFCPLWVTSEGFLELVLESWKKSVSGSPFFIWEEKLRRLKVDLKKWAKNLPSPLLERKKAHRSLENHQLHMESAPVTPAKLNDEVELQKKLHKALRKEEEYWRVKSRSLWLQAGDKNTSFFHKQAESRKNHNSIREIHFQGQTFKKYEEIKLAAHSFYKNLFTEELETPPSQDLYPLSVVPNLLNEDDNRLLTAPITIEEISKVLQAMNPDKAPGPDGFTPRFYTACWDIVKKDLVKMVRKSQNCSKIGGSTNSSFLALIPKEKGAQSFARFRPISLCNTGYKIITKVIANRIKKVLPRIIPENQGGFIQGRQIQDNIILVQEAIHSSCQRKEKGMLIKLDLANAFDRVRLNFLFAVMFKMGFHPHMVRWIKACIEGPWIAPLVNGRPAEFFQASRGLRQGCPLSPLLYAIQASVLSFQLNKRLQQRTLIGLSIAPRVERINHAQFADDTLLLGQANLPTARAFKKELDDYTEISGSEISLRKSNIYGWNCPPIEMIGIARALEMEGTSTWESIKYLGIPLVKAAPRSSLWLPLLDKMKTRILAWGSTWLNKAGKLILINSVLTSLPVYQASLLLAPRGIVREIDNIMRKFLWEGGRNEGKKMHLFSWDKVKGPRLEGGLQVRDVATQNLAMGGKILWKMIRGNSTWSSKALRTKYFCGHKERCLERPPLTRKGSPILSLCLKALDLITSRLSWIPGNGRKIKFWEDSILGQTPLRSLKGLENIKSWLHSNNKFTLWDLSVWEQGGLWLKWDLGDYPQTLDTEARSLLEALQGCSPSSARKKDKRGWGSSSGCYSAAAGYAALQAIPWVAPDPSVWKNLWLLPSLPKIDLFCWSLLHDSILTWDNLSKRGWEGPSRCPLCACQAETSVHLFLLCPFALELWNLILGQLNVPLPASVTSLFTSWVVLAPFSFTNLSLLKHCWMWVPKVVCWKLWLERNSRIFRDIAGTPTQTALKVKAMLGDLVASKTNVTNEVTPNKDEYAWFHELEPSLLNRTKKIPKHYSHWEIRLEEQEFIKWRSSLEKHILQVDGASKGNPGPAGSGGVLFDISGKIVLSFAWGLGQNTNNTAEILAIWQGLAQVRRLSIAKLAVIGDSRIFIQALNQRRAPKNMGLEHYYKKVTDQMKEFEEVKFYHVLRNLNQLADHEANRGTTLGKGVINVNGIENHEPIP